MGASGGRRLPIGSRLARTRVAENASHPHMRNAPRKTDHRFSKIAAHAIHPHRAARERTAFAKEHPLQPRRRRSHLHGEGQGQPHRANSERQPPPPRATTATSAPAPISAPQARWRSTTSRSRSRRQSKIRASSHKLVQAPLCRQP